MITGTIIIVLLVRVIIAVYRGLRGPVCNRARSVERAKTSANMARKIKSVNECLQRVNDDLGRPIQYRITVNGEDILKNKLRMSDRDLSKQRRRIAAIEAEQRRVERDAAKREVAARREAERKAAADRKAAEAERKAGFAKMQAEDDIHHYKRELEQLDELYEYYNGICSAARQRFTSPEKNARTIAAAKKQMIAIQSKSRTIAKKLERAQYIVAG